MLGHLQATVIKFRLIYLQDQKMSRYDTVVNFLNDDTLISTKIPRAKHFISNIWLMINQHW